MSIQVIDNFDINVSKPLDNRFVVGPNSFYQTRHDIQWKYEGLRIWDLNDSQPYVYNGLTWSAEATATLQGPGTPSFIPKYSGTGNVSNSLSNSVICELFDSVNTNILIGYTSPIVQSNNPQPTARLQVKGHIRTEFPYGFFGDGANLTNLNATNVTQGSLNLARLSISSSSPNWILSRNASSAVWINPATSLTAATASALATTTSFWGQNYNGTQNVVGGDMTINGQISRVIRLNLLSGAVNQQSAKLARIEFGSGATFNKTIFVPSNAGVATNTDTFALLGTSQTFTEAQTLSSSLTVGGVTTLNNTLRVNISSSQKLLVLSDRVVFGQQSFTLNTPGGPISVPVNSPMIRTGLSATSSAPSFTWNNDENLGIYRPAVDVMGFVSGGVEKMRVNTSGVSLISNTPSDIWQVTGLVSDRWVSNLTGSTTPVATDLPSSPHDRILYAIAATGVEINMFLETSPGIFTFVSRTSMMIIPANSKFRIFLNHSSGTPTCAFTIYKFGIY